MDLWDITNRISTKTKLELIERIFNMWLTIWNGSKQKWAHNREWYVLDLFAGRGYYIDKSREEKKVSGSFIVFLKVISSHIEKLENNGVKIKLFGVEKNKSNYQELRKEVETFLKNRPYLKSVVSYQIINGDCNKEIDRIIQKITNSLKRPLFILIDPTGLQIKRTTMERIVNLRNPKDILFNYILEGVRRTSGIASKLARGEGISKREIKTIETLIEFLGRDIEIIKEKRPGDLEVLEDYVNSLFADKNLHVVGYNVKYPNRNDELYYLLFASRKPKITQIVKDIYARQRQKTEGLSLFGLNGYKNSILEVKPENKKRVLFIKRKSLLYQTKVEYGDWTINHIIGCIHGCRFPCYAMMMAKRFGWIKDYNDWRRPRIAQNAIEILEREILKYKNKINFVHLSFMSDPFMYDIDTDDLIPEVKKSTLEIISLLNRNGIKVTTLTKGYYPERILEMDLLPDNEYGITLVSLNKRFKENFEPYSAPYERRIKSLYELHKAGLKTWVSIEPYPTPNLDKEAKNIERLLEEVSFVDKIIFGKMNYNIQSRHFKNSEEFYQKMARKVIEFCNRYEIKYHIKFGTPYSREETKDIFNGEPS
jgi:three-Cys-motif partner protein